MQVIVTEGLMHWSCSNFRSHQIMHSLPETIRTTQNGCSINHRWALWVLDKHKCIWASVCNRDWQVITYYFFLQNASAWQKKMANPTVLMIYRDGLSLFKFKEKQKKMSKWYGCDSGGRNLLEFWCTAELSTGSRILAHR